MKLINNRGQSLIEILIVIALTAILLPPLFYALMASRQARPQQNVRFRASEILKETQDSLRIIRENSWSSIATPGTYHLVRSGNTWILSPGSEIINGITRQIAISDVQRLNGQIVTSGGTNDPSTKQAVITVSWSEPLVTSLSSTLYLTRYLENATYTQTTEDDFETGTYPGLAITTNGDGELVLGAGGEGNWCSPTLTISALDLPKQGVANSITAIEGEAFVGTGENASGVSLANVLINNSDPPSASIYGTFDGYKTNDVFGENNYFYVATHRPNREIVIIDISNTPFSEVGYFNAPPGIENGAQGIFVVGNVGYAVVTDKLYSFDLSSKIGSRPIMDSNGVTLSGTGKKIHVVGNYAYIAIDSGSKELQIVDISNPNNLTLAGSLDVDPINSGERGVDIFVNETGTRAYLAVVATSGKEFYIIDTTNKSSPIVLGSYEANGMSPKGITVVTGNNAILVGGGGEEYQVINIANESNPTRCGGLEVDAGINGIASVIEDDGDAYSYIITGDANSEFKIIEGGPGGTFSTEGTYESATFDIGLPLAFNRILPTFTKPVNTNITFQIAVADPVSGSCTGANYVFTGPDGLETSFYEGTDLIALNDDGAGYENPGRCFRYRAILSSTDSNSTPIFEQVIINYSL